MKNFALASAIFISLFLCHDIFSGDKFTMTLAEAKQLAIQQNPTVSQAKAAIAAAAAAVKQAESYYWPTVSLDLEAINYSDYPYRSERDTYKMQMLNSGTSTVSKHYDRHSQWNAGASARWIIFDGFGREMNLASAQLASDATVSDSENIQRLLTQSVAYAFYAALLSQDTVRIYRQEADMNKILLDDTQKRNRSGLVKPSEVKNFELKVGNSEVDCINAENQWKVNCIALGELLGIVQEDIWDSIELVKPTDDELARESESFTALAEYAFSHRPDYKRALDEIEIYKCDIKAAKASYLPTISAFATYGYQRNNKMKFNQNVDRYMTYGANLSWELFNGGLTANRVKAAEANLQIAIHSKEELELNIRSSIRQCLLNVDACRSKLEQQQNLVVTAREIYDLVYEEYKGGRTSVTRVNDALKDLTISELTASQFRIQLMNYYEQLDATIGRRQ